MSANDICLICHLDDETDMKELEGHVRSIEKDGLVWGGSKFVAVGFGIKKLQINLVIEDDKISLDELQQEIEEFEDHVQSTDIVRHTCDHQDNVANHTTRLLCKSCRMPVLELNTVLRSVLGYDVPHLSRIDNCQYNDMP